MHVVEARLIDDADDGQQILAIVAERNLRPESTAARKELSREAAIDQRLPHAVATRSLERTPLNHVHTHHLDIAGADAHVVDQRRIPISVAGDARRAGNRDPVLTRRRRQRQRRGRADCRDTGDRLQRLLDALLQRLRLLDSWNELRRHRHTHGEKTAGREAGIGAQQPIEAAQDQAAGREKHQRQGDLRDDHRATQPASSAAAADRAAGQQRRQVRACRPGGGRDRREQTEDTTQADDDGSDLPIHGHRFAPRQIERRQCDERARAPDGCERSRGAARQAEQAAFEQRGTNHRAAVGAERARHGELVLALRGACHQHRRQVDHQHEDEQHAGKSQDDERRTDAGHQVLPQADRIELQPTVLEVAGIDQPADGVDGCRHGLRRGAAAGAHQTGIRARARIGGREVEAAASCRRRRAAAVRGWRCARTRTSAAGRRSRYTARHCNRTVVPRIARSAPARCHNSCVSTITGGRFGPPSSFAKPRPRTGCTPSRSKRFGDVTITEISVASAPSRAANVVSCRSRPAASSMTPPVFCNSATSVPPSQPRPRSKNAR